jgi:hypothetical protein
MAMPSRYFEMNVNYFRSDRSIAVPPGDFRFLALFGPRTMSDLGPLCGLEADIIADLRS